MEIRILNYFLIIAKEESFTKAARILNITQPTLSRQISSLERELNQTLFIRGKRKVELTEAGMYLKNRVEEIIAMIEKTHEEMINFNSSLKGDIYIGAGESSSIGKIIKICHSIQLKYPSIHFHFTSGDSLDLLERLDNGLFDFCIIFGEINEQKYNLIKLPYEEIWNLVMKKEDPLANKNLIEPRDIINSPLIMSRQSVNSQNILNWFNKKAYELNISNTYSLVNNAIFMVKENMGYLLTLKNIVDISNYDLIYKDLEPEIKLNLSIVRKKNKILSNVAESFLELLKKTIN